MFFAVDIDGVPARDTIGYATYLNCYFQLGIADAVIEDLADYARFITVVVTVSHSVFVIIYHVLQKKQSSTNLGADSFDKLDAPHMQRRHIQRLEQLDFTITLTPKAATSCRTQSGMGAFS